jgi:hypothetical protein
MKLRIILLLLIAFNLGGQKKSTPLKPKETPDVIARRNAQKAFDRGDYITAKSLYEFSAKLIGFENIKENNSNIRKCEGILRKKQEALNAFVKGDYVKSENLYSEIIRLNPLDLDAKKGENLSKSDKPKDSNTDDTKKKILYASTLPTKDGIAFLSKINKEKPTKEYERAIIRVN